MLNDHHVYDGLAELIQIGNQLNTGNDIVLEVLRSIDSKMTEFVESADKVIRLHAYKTVEKGVHPDMKGKSGRCVQVPLEPGTGAVGTKAADGAVGDMHERGKQFMQPGIDAADRAEQGTGVGEPPRVFQDFGKLGTKADDGEVYTDVVSQCIRCGLDAIDVSGVCANCGCTNDSVE